MGFVRLMYFCQMEPTIGPIVISIKKIIKDICLVAVTHLTNIIRSTSERLGVLHLAATLLLVVADLF